MQVIAYAKNLVEMLHTRFEIAQRNIVNLPQQLEGFNHSDVPPNVRPLPKNHSDGFYIVPAVAEWDESIDSDFAARGNHNPREHLDGFRLASNIRADITDHFAPVD